MQIDESQSYGIETSSVGGFVRYMKNSTCCLMQAGFYRV
jgi:hypothetical protein